MKMLVEEVYDRLSGKEGIRDDEIKNAIKNMLESELSGKSAVIWPQNSKSIPD